MHFYLEMKKIVFQPPLLSFKTLPSKAQHGSIQSCLRTIPRVWENPKEHSHSQRIKWPSLHPVFKEKYMIIWLQKVALCFERHTSLSRDSDDIFEDPYQIPSKRDGNSLETHCLFPFWKWKRLQSNPKSQIPIVSNLFFSATCCMVQICLAAIDSHWNITYLLPTMMSLFCYNLYNKGSSLLFQLNETMWHLPLLF